MNFCMRKYFDYKKQFQINPKREKNRNENGNGKPNTKTSIIIYQICENQKEKMENNGKFEKK